MIGPIARLLSDDHRRLEGLLDRACADPDRIDRVVFEEFRAGLLRHIGIEEKILLPAAQRARGIPLALAGQLRLDHGAIAAMLVPSPTPNGIARIRRLLEQHDSLEEGPAGVYAACDELLAGDVEKLVTACANYPAVRTAPHHDGPLVERHIEDCLKRAGR